ncbi:conjugal transfer protein TraI [Nostoc sp. 3335mG]|nr:conjugal transfer protein TraI [Nostoc sp. 3335mG]
MSDDIFEPKLGRIRARGGKRGQKYLGRVVASAARAGQQFGKRKVGFDGSRIGRGAGTGRILSSRDRHAGLRARRAVVKTRLVKLGAKGGKAAAAHLRYIQRDGVTREGDPGQLYSAEQDQANGNEFLERSVGDRHQFRFIVSAEDGDEYPDLKPLIRRLMTQAEQDLGTRLDWVAVDHFNTGHSHTHIMLRGVDDQGRDLIIAREYISHGLRERAAELVQLDLGPRTDLEIEARLRHDVDAERLTVIDRRLGRDMDADRIVSAAHADPFQQALRAGRLQTLGKLGLAEDVGGGRWRLADGLEETLRRMGEQGDIIRTMQRELTARKLDRPGVSQRLYDPDEGHAAPIVGKVIQRGLADEHHDRHYLLVDGIDGQVHYVPIGLGDAVAPIAEGSVVRITQTSVAVRETDRTIDRVARANSGIYSIDAHLRRDPQASERFAETHVRRLEAMRHRGDLVERLPDGRWRIAEDHLARVEEYERRIRRDRPVEVAVVSPRPVERLIGTEAATWIDRRLVGELIEPARDAGFGHDVRNAEARRRQWLIEQELAIETDGTTAYQKDMVEQLRRRELLRLGGQLSRDLGIQFVEAHEGERIEGVFRRPVDTVSGRLALVERAHDFTLVPWRPTLERQIDKPVSGIMREAGISWSIGLERGGPSIG